MIDYLSPKEIAKTDAIISGGLMPEDIRDAVFRLWLEPNDVWARGILTGYIRYRNDSGDEKTFERETALQSRIMSRIAHGIHRYDRYHEPLLIFLTRIVINANNDLDSTQKRLKKEPKSFEQQHKTLMQTDEGRELSAAAAKLGVSSDSLRELLREFKRNREDSGSELSIGEMAAKLGIKPFKLEAMLFDISASDADDGELWVETPQSLEEKGLAYDITSSVMGDLAQGRNSLDDHDGDERVLHSVSLADVRFQNYLIKLSYEKPCGEWVSQASRRQVIIDGKKRVIAVEAPSLQMSEDERTAVMQKLDDFQNNITLFKQTIKQSAKDNDNGKEKKQSQSMPPLEEFKIWYNNNLTNAWYCKQKSMYFFLYQEYYLSGNRNGWKNYNAQYTTKYNSDVPVSAQKALYRMKKSFIPEFLKNREKRE